MSLILAHSGCGGGQTGQPSSIAEPCEDGEVRNGFECCLEVGPDEPVRGRTGREIVEQYASTRTLLFWGDLSSPELAPEWFERDDLTEDELTVTVELDESTPVRLCDEDRLDVPVAISLATRGGYANRFSATLSSRAESPFSILPTSETHFAEDFRKACGPDFLFAEHALWGRFCDSERGIALFPAACGGVVQAPPEEAPFADLEAPAEFFAGFEEATMTYPDESAGLPPIVLKSRLDDPTACYADASTYAIQGSFRVETDGVTFEAEKVRGQSATTRFEEPPARSLRFERFCVDVSSAPGWTAVRDEAGFAGALCFGVSHGRREDGAPDSRLVVTFEDSVIDWVFTVH